MPVIAAASRPAKLKAPRPTAATRANFRAAGWPVRLRQTRASCRCHAEIDGGRTRHGAGDPIRYMPVGSPMGKAAGRTAATRGAPISRDMACCEISAPAWRAEGGPGLAIEHTRVLSKPHQRHVLNWIWARRKAIPYSDRFMVMNILGYGMRYHLMWPCPVDRPVPCWAQRP